jgi:hypothetical protein
MNDDPEVKNEAIWAICNSVSVGTPENIQNLVSLGAIQAISSLLTEKNSRLLMVSMEGLRYILNCGSEHFRDE